MKTYGKVSEFRKMTVKVILDDKVLYEGSVDDAPSDIKDMHYTKALLGKPTEIYVVKED